MSEERAVWTPDHDPEVRSISWNNLLLSDELFGSKSLTSADVRINPDTALQSTFFLSCARIISETVSGLPLNVYRRIKGGGDQIASDVPLHRVLSFAPNGWQTKFEWLESLCMSVILWGNSYTEVRSGRYGSVTELHNLHASRMNVERLENGRLKYTYNAPDGRLMHFTQDQIMHVRWTPEPDGLKGMIPAEISRDAIALSRACEIYASKFWANMGRPGVVLQTEGSLSQEAAERLRDNWERIHRGVANAYKTCVLTNGLKVESFGATNSESQFLDVRRFQGEEICRVLRLPVHLVQGQSGGGSLEVQGQEFVTYTLMPWLTRIEQAISRSLIYDDDTYYAKFDTRGLLRGDSNSRAAYYSTMMNLGVLSIADVRKMEGFDPIGPEAETHMIAMNLQPLAEAVKPKPEPPPAGGPPAPVPGSPPSLSGVETGKAPAESPKGEPSEKKPEPRGFCPTGEGGGIDNSCGTKVMSAPDTGGGGGGGGGSPEPAAAISRLLEKIAENPQGFTLDPLSADQPPNGIMVSEYSNDSVRSVKIKAAEIMTTAGAARFSQWFSANKDLLLDGQNKFVGGWRTGDDFYVDVATRYGPDQAEAALEAGRKAGQLAVFNLETFKETWVKYEPGDDRKPPDYDEGYAKTLAASQVYKSGESSPDDGDDVAEDLRRHGKTTVRAYNAESEENADDPASTAIRHPREADSYRVLPRFPLLFGTGRGVQGTDARSRVVRGQPGAEAGTVLGSAAPSEAELLTKAAAGDAFGEMPAVEYRSCGGACAHYDFSSDTLFVSPDAVEFRDDGWTSQPNPVTHELARRRHATTSRETFESPATLSPDQAIVAGAVSRYATTGTCEFIAEVVAGTMYGHRYPSEVLSLFESLTDGRVPL